MVLIPLFNVPPGIFIFTSCVFILWHTAACMCDGSRALIGCDRGPLPVFKLL